MLLTAENINKIYKDGKKDLPVLKGVSLSLKKGEMVAIVGPSGAGKSTLLHILGGLDIPTEGEVLFDGRDLYAIDDEERSLIRNRRIGFVFQLYHLLPEFSAFENVIMPALIYTSKGKDRKELQGKAKEIIKTVGLEERINHNPSELSGGEAQRVAVARALINEPDIVLCDEPTGNLDSENSEIILKLIKELNRKRGQTFLIVTHNEKVAALAERIIHIRDGLLV